MLREQFKLMWPMRLLAAKGHHQRGTTGGAATALRYEKGVVRMVSPMKEESVRVWLCTESNM